MLNAEFVKAVFAGLRILADSDADHAKEQNGAGFNRADSAIGHDLANADMLTEKQLRLAASLLVKYCRQLPQYICDQLRSQ